MNKNLLRNSLTVLSGLLLLISFFTQGLVSISVLFMGLVVVLIGIYFNK